MLKRTYIFAAALLGLASCKQKSPNSSDNTNNTAVAVEKQISPDFNADSSYSFVKKQVDFGPRIPGTAAHAECSRYLQQKLK